MCQGGYYSPRIKEDLIPVLYRLGKLEGRPMTVLLDAILRNELKCWRSCKNVSKKAV